jgi:flagellar motor switch protein FliG
MFKEDMANLGPVRLRDVDEAQAAVVVMAKDLAAQGQITLQEGREDEMVY